MPTPNPVPLPANGGQVVVLVPRDQLRFTAHGRTLFIPYHLESVAATVPTPPGVFDGSKGRAIQYPILGNDQVGDCYYADACHCVQTWMASAGNPVAFDPISVMRRYQQISGGDNGLSDQQIFPEWKAGIVGPNGPHRILDEMTIDPNDEAAIHLGLWLFNGASYTAALADAWIRTAAPGVIWDTGTPNPRNGHAMHLSGFVVKGERLPFAIPGAAAGTPSPFSFFCDETWGFGTPVLLTLAGLRSCQPEITVQFSTEMFSAQGIAPHNNMTYDQLATLWVQLGGQHLPPSPFVNPPVPVPPAPTPGPGPKPPLPPTPTPSPAKVFSLNFAQPVRKGQRIQFAAPVAVPAGAYDVVHSGAAHEVFEIDAVA